MIRDVVILTPVYVAFFWALTFLLQKFSTNRARYWLGLFMAVVTVLYTCHALFFYKLQEVYLDLDFLYLLAGLLVYPMYYIYIRLLTCDVHLKRAYLLHFVPAIVLGIALFAAHQSATMAERELYYDNVLVRNKWVNSDDTSGFMFLAFVFYSSRIVFGIQALGYLCLGYYLVRKYNGRIANFYSNTEGRELRWVNLLTVSFLATSILSSVANLVGRGVFLDHTAWLAFPSLMFSTLFFVIGLLGNRQNFTIGSFNEDKRDDEEINDPLPVQNEKLKSELIYLLQDKKRFLDPDLKITDLCRELNTNRTYLSNLINREFHLNFNDLINRYRVEYSISLMKNNRNRNDSLLAIATEAGFGSVSSFYRAFRKNKGMSASVFKEQHSRQNTNNELSGHTWGD